MTPTARYDALARVLLDSPDPVHAIASLIGDHEGRIDALCRRVDHLDAALDALHAASALASSP